MKSMKPLIKTPSLGLSLACALLLSACATAASVAPCNTYCSSVDQGYQWAQNARLLDAAACAGYAANFSAGCRQAVRDAQLSANPRDAY